MNKFFVLLLFIISNPNFITQWTQKDIVFDDAQVSGLVSAIEYCKSNYSNEIYRLIFVDSGAEITLSCYVSPSLRGAKGVVLGGGKTINITYSKILKKVIKSKIVYLR